MNESKIETTKGLCVIAVTKYLMQYFEESQEEAYRRLLAMELYELLSDSDTRLFMETNEYLCQCCKIECEQGKDALYEFINVY